MHLVGAWALGQGQEDLDSLGPGMLRLQVTVQGVADYGVDAAAAAPRLRRDPVVLIVTEQQLEATFKN